MWSWKGNLWIPEKIYEYFRLSDQVSYSGRDPKGLSKAREALASAEAEDLACLENMYFNTAIKSIKSCLFWEI